VRTVSSEFPDARRRIYRQAFGRLTAVGRVESRKRAAARSSASSSGAVSAALSTAWVSSASAVADGGRDELDD